jgi:hypothetical protein
MSGSRVCQRPVACSRPERVACSSCSLCSLKRLAEARSAAVAASSAIRGWDEMTK